MTTSTTGTSTRTPFQWTATADEILAKVKLAHFNIVADVIVADAVDSYALATQIQLYRSAAQIGLTQISARSSTVVKKHNALTARLLD